MVLVYVTLLVAQLGDQVMNFNLWVIVTLLAATIIFILVFWWDFIKRFYYTFFRDIRAGWALLKSRYFMYKYRNSNVPKLFSYLEEKHPDKVCFYYKDEKWTYNDIERFSNKVANYFASIGFQKNDEVALVMNSRPEFVGIWLGLAKQGIVTAFINTNQRMETLVHSITVVNCKAVIYDVTLAKSIQEAIPMIKSKRPEMLYFSYVGIDPPSVKAWEQDQETVKKIGGKLLDVCIENMLYTRPLAIDQQTMNDKLYYIFTSGTTGLPKAAVIRHHRYIWIGMILNNLFNIRKDDILYLTLPLYHNNAGTIGSCQAIIFGTSIVLRDKFSASQFWDDCIRYNCTVGMYIGELCRYLLAQPKKVTDTTHKIRLMFGNGLRQEIWSDFKNRFNIKQIGEVYGSTEGNANVANYDFKEGACGIIPCCVPFICRMVFPVTVIKIDPITGEHARNRNGLCKLIKPGEIGEIVGMIRDDAAQSYPGYVNNEATKKKVIRNVFRHGDSAFLSGDLVEMDYYGYLYFRDRTGDTFRWKGENVSTNEVEAVIQKVVKLSDCVVFGVSILNCDGKAGMAVIADPNRTINVENLFNELDKRLPAYAVPLFIRIVSKIDLTASFKLSKTSLEKEGFNAHQIRDPLYYLDRKLKKYTSLDHTSYEDIQNDVLLHEENLILISNENLVNMQQDQEIMRQYPSSTPSTGPSSPSDAELSQHTLKEKKSSKYKRKSSYNDDDDNSQYLSSRASTPVSSQQQQPMTAPSSTSIEEKSSLCFMPLVREEFQNHQQHPIKFYYHQQFMAAVAEQQQQNSQGLKQLGIPRHSYSLSVNRIQQANWTMYRHHNVDHHSNGYSEHHQGNYHHQQQQSQTFFQIPPEVIQQQEQRQAYQEQQQQKISIHQQQQYHKKISKPMIEKRRRDRINRCLSLLKELIIDSKRYPISNYNKSRFEKADILEITVKYLESLILEEHRIYQQGFEDCKKQVVQFINKRFNDDNKNDSSKSSETTTTTTSSSPSIQTIPFKSELKDHKEDDKKIKMVTHENNCDDRQQNDLISKIFGQLLEHLNAASEKLGKEKHGQIMSVNLSTLFAELNDIKSRSASVSDSDGQYSADELQLSDNNCNSDNELRLIKNKFMAKHHHHHQQHGVIQHTRNYHCNLERTHQQQVNNNNNVSNIKDYDTSNHLIKKLDQLNLEQQSKNNRLDERQQKQPKPMTLKSKLLSSCGSSSPSSSTLSSSSSSLSPNSSSASSCSSSSSSTKSEYSPHSTTLLLTNLLTSTKMVNTHPLPCDTAPSPFYAEIALTQPRNYVGNERNGSELPNYEAIWRPWGYGHQ